MEEKRFDEWNKLKQDIHQHNISLIYREREIWWVSIGENIGSEINGKGEKFLRPVLVVRKHGESFYGVPLSSKSHKGIWYETFLYKDRTQCALLSQSRTFSANRLVYKMGRLSNEDYNKICIALKALIFRNK